MTSRLSIPRLLVSVSATRARIDLEVLIFELKNIGWWFWCQGLCVLRVKESDGTIHFDGMSVHLSIHLSIRSPICSSTHLSFCLVVCLSVLRSLYLSIHQCLVIKITFIPSFISLADHKADLCSICQICLSGLHRGLLLTVTGDCTCLVVSASVKFVCVHLKIHVFFQDPWYFRSSF